MESLVWHAANIASLLATSLVYAYKAGSCRDRLKTDWSDAYAGRGLDGTLSDSDFAVQLCLLSYNTNPISLSGTRPVDLESVIDIIVL